MRTNKTCLPCDILSDGSVDYYCPLQLNGTHTMVTGGYPKEDDYPDTKVSFDRKGRNGAES